MSEPPVLLVCNNLEIKLFTSPNGIAVEVQAKPAVFYTWWNVVWVDLRDGGLRLDVVQPSLKSPASQLVSYKGEFEPHESHRMQVWRDRAMELAYPDSSPSRRLTVLVNPFGGQGRALSIFNRIVKPIFEAGHCPLQIFHTEHAKHAYALVKSMAPDVDCIVPVSGDGLVHECFNGLADHPQRSAALEIPIAPIPAGSANGLCVNLFGVKEAFNIGHACLNAMKGRKMAADLCSVTQGEKRSWSFMSVALGLMAELDLGTEHLRWMGESRFMYGFLRGVIGNKECPVQLEFKQSYQDKSQLLAAWNTGKLPALTAGDSEHRHSEGGDWKKFEKPWLFCVAGKVPYVARNMNQFPIAMPSDGFLDVVVQEKTPRGKILSGIQLGKNGQFYFESTCHYIKCKGFRITPAATDGYLAVDGERFPFEPCEVEVHPGLANIMSPTGVYFNDFAGKKLAA